MVDDRTTRAVIRDEALRLFAIRGPDAVTVRQVAEAAGVSAALVMHHFGSKDVLRESVDQYVLQLLDGMIGELTGTTRREETDPPRPAGPTTFREHDAAAARGHDAGTARGGEGGAGRGGGALPDVGALVKAVLQHLPAGSPVPAYLRRLLLTDGEAGRRLFRRLYDLSRFQLDALVAAGMASPGEDPAARAAFLMVNDLAVLLLRDRLTDVLGSDPLSSEGLTRYASEAMAVYSDGLGPTEPTP